MLPLLQISPEGWGDGSAVNSSVCSSRRSGFDSQHLYSGSQLSATPVLGYPIISPGLLWYFKHVVHRHVRQNSHWHKIKIINLKKKSCSVELVLPLLLNSEVSELFCAGAHTKQGLYHWAIPSFLA